MGWTMRDLWRHSKVSIDAISRLERGKGTLQVRTLDDLRTTFVAAGVTFARNAALANKMARIAWALLVKGGPYRARALVAAA